MNIEHINDHQAFCCECGSVHFNLLKSLTIECSNCHKQFGMWRNFDSELLFSALREIVDRIELCGASLELTRAVMLASDTMMAVGNKWNTPDKYSLERVTFSIKK